MRLVDSCISPLTVQGPSRTWNESKEEEGVANRSDGNLSFRHLGHGRKVEVLGIKVQGSRCRVPGSRCRVQG